MTFIIVDSTLVVVVVVVDAAIKIPIVNSKLKAVPIGTMYLKVF